jgi:hypothetical protein
MSVQYVTVASQKFTCPIVSAVVPALTDAVSDTTLPEATVVTELPPEVTARLVVVAVLVCAEATRHIPSRLETRTPPRAARTPDFRSWPKIRLERTPRVAKPANLETANMEE